MTTTIRSMAAAAATMGILLAGCGTTSSNTAATVAPTTVPPTTAAMQSGYGGGAAASTSGSATYQEGALSTRSTTLGAVLVNDSGMTLYVFMKDSGGKSACSGACATNWPPLAAKDAAAAAAGLDKAKLGSIMRDDGSKQATYDGQPLYVFSGDKAAGDVKGQGTGGIWFADAPNGAVKS